MAKATEEQQRTKRKDTAAVEKGDHATGVELQSWSTLSVAGGIARLSIDMPGQRVNLLTPQAMLELARHIDELAGRVDVKCLVITSRKPGIFIAGADIKEIAAISSPEEAEEKSGSGQEVLNRLEDLPFPTVAVIDGAALGGGLELALACDYRLATDNPKTKLGLPETQLGIIPGFGGTYRLPRAVGPAQALSMILSGSPIDGKKAAKVGLADACYAAAFIEDKTEAFVAGLLDGNGAHTRTRKRKPVGIRLLENNPLGRALLFRSARKDVLRRTGGHYPAALAAVRVVRKNLGASRSRALKLERATFGRLAPTVVSKNLIQLFFAREAVKRPPEPDSRAATDGRSPAARRATKPRKSSAAAAPPRERVRRAAVLGAGVMGGKIAWLFTKYDIPVVMKDIAWSAIQTGYASAHGVYRELARKRRYSGREINLKMHLLSGTLDYGSLMNPDAVVEAVVENLKVKKQVLSEVEGAVGDQTIIASNTSSLSITEMATALKRPQRFVGMHFFNPPNRMPLVEVIPGAKTDPTTVRATAELALALGKTPIVVKDCPGFLVNRLLLPYLNEAARMVEEGIDYVRIDKLLEAFGMPMGPFTLLDEIGIDVAIEVADVLAAAYSGRMEAAHIFEALRGRTDLLGKKGGKGFYLHAGGSGTGKKRSVNPEMPRLLRSRSGVGGKSRVSDTDIVHRPILALLNEAALALAEGVVATGQELDLALILGTGFPPFRGGILAYADELGLTEVKARLDRYATSFGERFKPAPLLEELAASGKPIAASAIPRDVPQAKR